MLHDRFLCVLCVVIMGFVFVSACDDDEESGSIGGDGTLSGCAGDYSGTYKGDVSGDVKADLKKSGILLVTFVSAASDSNSDIQGGGTVSDDGSITGRGQGVLISGDANFDSCVLAGDWSALGGGNGTWKIGRKSAD